MSDNSSSQAVVLSKQPSQDQRKKSTVKNYWMKFLPSTTTTGIALYIIIALLMNGGLNPFVQRGFFCNDTSINYPVKTDTVSFRSLLVVALVLPLIVIKFCVKRLSRLLDDVKFQPGRFQDVRLRHGGRRRSNEREPEDEKLMSHPDRAKRPFTASNHSDSDGDSNDLSDCDSPFAHLSLNSDIKERYSVKSNIANYYALGKCEPTRTFSDIQLFLFGFATTAFLTGLGKMAGGRFRPHFLQRCQPDVDCSLSSNTNRYIENFKCTSGLRSRDFNYITTSWPSGHASIVFYSMIYMIVYMNATIPALFELSPKRGRRKFDLMCLYVIYVLMMGVAGYISMTRISDYHHHPLDVLSGSIIGSIVALLLSKYSFVTGFYEFLAIVIDR